MYSSPNLHVFSLMVLYALVDLWHKCLSEHLLVQTGRVNNMQWPQRNAQVVRHLELLGMLKWAFTSPVLPGPNGGAHSAPQDS